MKIVRKMARLAAVGLAAGGLARADAIDWIGAGGGVWSAPENWSGGAVPGGADAVRLADGAKLTVDAATLLRKGALIDDWSVAGAWSFGGVTCEPGKGYTENVAHVREDGALVLTDDTGAQRNYAFLKRYSFGMDDTFEASYTYSARMLGRYANEQMAEGFGCCFGRNTVAFGWSHLCAMSTGAYGFIVKVWGSGGFAWVDGRDEVVPSNPTVTGPEMGIDFRQPVRITVRFEKGLMTVTMRQGDAVWSDARDISAGFANGERRWFGFTAGTNTNGLYAYQVISDFEGRSVECGGVVRDGYLPFSTDGWQLNQRDGKTAVSVVSGDEIMMNKVTGAQGSVVCKKRISMREAFRVEFRECLSNVGSWGEGFSVSLQPNTLNPAFGGDRFSCGESNALSFGHKWWDNLFRWNNQADGSGVVADSTPNPNGVRLTADAEYDFSLLYDGCGKFTARVRRGTALYEVTQDCPGALDWNDGAYLAFQFGSIWNNSIECHVNSPRLGFVYDGATEIANRLEVVPGGRAELDFANLTADADRAAASVSCLKLGAGSELTLANATRKPVRVAAGVLTAEGEATLKVAAGNVVELAELLVDGVVAVDGLWTAKGGILTLVVPRSRARENGLLAVLDSEGYRGAEPPAFKVLDEDGKPYGSGSALEYDNGELRLSLPGFKVIVR